MPSAEGVSEGEHFREISQGVQELLAEEAKLNLELRASQDRLQAAEAAVQALRENLLGLEKLLKKEAAKLDPEDKAAAKVVARLKTLQRKAGKAVRAYERAQKKLGKSQQELTESPEKNDGPEHPLLVRVNAMAELYEKEAHQQKRRLFIAGLALIALPLAGFVLGQQAKSQAVPVQDITPPQEQGGDITIAPSPEPESKLYYTVKSGDTLSQIAKFFYGDSSQWLKIYEANKEVIANPHRIQPGQELIIP